LRVFARRRFSDDIGFTGHHQLPTEITNRAGRQQYHHSLQLAAA
jgi:hypothetical protein